MVISDTDLSILFQEMWQLTYEEVQQVHQALVTIWTFDNAEPKVEMVMLKAENITVEKKLKRNNLRNQTLTDGDNVVLREDIAGWQRLEEVLIKLEVDISQIGDCP